MQKSPLQLKQSVTTTIGGHTPQSTASQSNFSDNGSGVPRVLQVGRLPRLAEEWFADCQMRQHSPRTIEMRRTLIGLLFWFLQEQGAQECTRTEIRQFMAYLATGHEHKKARVELELPPFSRELKRDGFWFLSSNSTGFW